MYEPIEAAKWEDLYAAWTRKQGPWIDLAMDVAFMPDDQFGPVETAQWVYLRPSPQNERTVINGSGLESTALALARARENPEQTAVEWINAWCHELLGRRQLIRALGWQGAAYRLVESVYLCTNPKSNGYWHHAVTDTIPASFFGFQNWTDRSLSVTPPHDLDDLVECVVACAAMSAGLYGVVYRQNRRWAEREREREERERLAKAVPVR